MTENAKICGEFDSLSDDTQKAVLKSFRDLFRVSKNFNTPIDSRVLFEMYFSTYKNPRISESVIKCAMIKLGFEFKVISDDIHVYKIDVKPTF